MAKASELAKAGCPYLGRLYSDMDCQKFIEKILFDVGIRLDLKGSNAWYRKMTWVGSPEECKRKFGLIPVGAFLFIHAYDGGEEAKSYHDGKGNASHIGLYTGLTGQQMVDIAVTAGDSKAVNYNFGNGAIHSSQSREHVCTSNFSGKTIRGGWNVIGLWDRIDYGEKVNAILRGSSSGQAEHSGSEGGISTMYTATVSGGTPSSPINMRRNPNTNSSLIEQIPQGSKVAVLDDGSEWCTVVYKGMTGYVMKQFVHADAGQTTPDSPDTPIPSSDIQPGQKVNLILTYDQAVALLPILGSINDQLICKIGRG